MILAAFESEWVKLRRRHFLYGLFAAIALTVLLSSIVTILGASARAGGGGLSLAGLGRPSGFGQGLSASSVLLGAVALAIAAFQFGAEFSHGTLRNLLLRQPRRVMLLLGKSLAVLSFLLVALAIAAVLGAALAVVLAHVRGVPTASWVTPLGLTDFAVAFGDLSISVCGFAIIGMILGVLLRSPVIAMAVGLILLLPVGSIVAAAAPQSARWLPGQMMNAIAGGGTATTHFGPAVVTLACYLVVGAVLALAVFARRDVAN
jgi:ABC-2 type transport system permease protein